MRNGGRMLEVVKTFNEPYEADIAQAKLVANGIRAEIFNDAVGRANPFLIQAIGGIAVMVQTKDLARAKKILS